MERIKIRKDNDFVFLWGIERGGAPEDLSTVFEKKLYLHKSGTNENMDVEITGYEIINGNILRIEFSPEIAGDTGNYDFLFKYILPDNSLSDGERKCAVDVKAITIVGESSKADRISELSATSDIAFGLMGRALTYADLTQEQLAELQRPATEAAALVDEKVAGYDAKILEVNEAVRIANQTAQDVSDAEILRERAESDRKSAEENREQKESERNTAEENRNTKESERQTAEQLRTQAELNRQAELNSKAAHGYTAPEVPKTLKEIEQKADAVGLLAEYVYNGRREIHVTDVDVVNNTFTAVGHLLTNANEVFITYNNDIVNPYPIALYPEGISVRQRYHVVNATADTFQLSLYSGGAPVSINTHGEIGKYHFETRAFSFAISNLGDLKKARIIITGRMLWNHSSGYFTPTSGAHFQTGRVGYNVEILSIHADVNLFMDILIDWTGRLTKRMQIERITSSTSTANTQVSETIMSISGSNVFDNSFSAITFHNALWLANGSKIQIYKI